ncbi:hypothetical protein T265_00757 [Opisthorchis viverrini]|uniref:Uncharacterized protein n=1 Tax=Opisthorchis viverrini TaxID=6198 RepID=A0A075AJI7_OPIVI|nr:hypothetical protein T265_00757 [Opisthorchis viverrini]KER33454.1 hypothetical protein T265_00757 [Opisthorchis viverrini]
MEEPCFGTSIITQSEIQIKNIRTLSNMGDRARIKRRTTDVVNGLKGYKTDLAKRVVGDRNRINLTIMRARIQLERARSAKVVCACAHFEQRQTYTQLSNLIQSSYTTDYLDHDQE